jgi:hypothetical protein
MSAVSRAIELPKRWAKYEEVRSGPIMSRWGPPIWHTDELVAGAERVGPECGTLEVIILACLFSERPA